MTDAKQKLIEALNALPEDMREAAAAYLLQQAEKFRALKEQMNEGMNDIANGRMSEWNLERFLRRARRT
jgi:hypothetical protein